MRRLCVCLCMLMLVAGVSAQDKGGSASKPKTAKPAVDCSTANDAKLTQDIKDKIAKSKALKDLGIGVSVNGGVATLTGSVKSGLTKGTATRVAKSVPCITSVKNEITVVPKTARNNGARSNTA